MLPRSNGFNVLKNNKQKNVCLSLVKHGNDDANDSLTKLRVFLSIQLYFTDGVLVNQCANQRVASMNAVESRINETSDSSIPLNSIEATRCLPTVHILRT